jgi:hypothetical protein
MKTFKVNGKEYVAKAFDFNLICDLEDMGVSIGETANKPMSAVRAYFAICTGRGKEYAGQEMQAHILAGGSFDDVMNAMADEMEKSDFFRHLSEKAGQEVAENQSKKK